MKVAPVLLLLFIASNVNAQIYDKSVIHFKYGSYELLPESKKALDDLVVRLKDKDVVNVNISGHTDSDGSDRYNLLLSENRLTEVKNYLESKGISKDKLTVGFFGENRPVAENKSDEGKALNRRVDIVVTYQEKIAAINRHYDPILKIDSAQTKHVENNISSDDSAQVFTAMGSDEITLRGKKGTVVVIPKNSLVTDDEIPVADEIRFEMLEVYSKSDMIMNSVYTTANNKLLESSGMIHLKAYSKNRELKLKRNATYAVQFPANNLNAEMGLFYGDTVRKSINWRKSTQKYNSKVHATSGRKSKDKFTKESDDYANRNQFTFLAGRFGWINCDRFVTCCNMTALRATSDLKDMNYCLIFKSINSVMGTNNVANMASFMRIPRDMKVTVLAYKKEGAKVMYYCQDFTLNKSLYVNVKPEEITEKEFKKRVRQIS